MDARRCEETCQATQNVRCQACRADRSTLKSSTYFGVREGLSRQSCCVCHGVKLVPPDRSCSSCGEQNGFDAIYQFCRYVVSGTDMSIYIYISRHSIRYLTQKNDIEIAPHSGHVASSSATNPNLLALSDIASLLSPVSWSFPRYYRKPALSHRQKAGRLGQLYMSAVARPCLYTAKPA